MRADQLRAGPYGCRRCNLPGRGPVRDGADHDGESGRSGVGRTRNVTAPTSLTGQFELPYGPMGPPTLFTIPVLRYMTTYGLTHEQLAMVSVVQRECVVK